MLSQPCECTKHNGTKWVDSIAVKLFKNSNVENKK